MDWRNDPRIEEVADQIAIQLTPLVIELLGLDLDGTVELDELA